MKSKRHLHLVLRSTGRVNSALAVALALSVGACSEAPREVPVQEELVSINGTELFVKRMGHGDPIVVVHGGPVLEHSYFLPHLEPLAQSFELIFFDQRLSGRSAGHVDSSSVRLATFVDDIEALRQSLRLGNIHLMGHSWGGLLATLYAIEHSEHLASLVLVSPMSASSTLWQQEEALLSARRTEEDLAEFASIRESEAFANGDPDTIANILRTSFKVQFSDRSKIAGLELFVPNDYTERSRQFGYMMGDLTDFDFHDQLDGVTVRTLILFGAVEPSAELGGVALRDHIAGSEMVLIEYSGHFPFIEQNEAFTSTVRSFLTDTEH